MGRSATAAAGIVTALTLGALALVAIASRPDSGASLTVVPDERWGVAARLTPFGARNVLPRLAFGDDGSALATWVRANDAGLSGESPGTPLAVLEGRIRRPGAAWGPRFDISSPDALVMYAATTVAEGTGPLSVAWAQVPHDQLEDRRPQVSLLALGIRSEGPEGAPALLQRSASPPIGLDLARRGNLQALAWVDLAPGQSSDSPRATARVAVDAGAGWGDPVDLGGVVDLDSSGLLEAVHTVIDAEGRVYVLWVDRGPTGARIVVREREDDGTWSSPTPLSGDIDAADGDQIALTAASGADGSLAATWARRPSAGRFWRQAIAIRRPGAAWSAPRAMRGRSPEPAALAVDGRGDVIVARSRPHASGVAVVTFVRGGSPVVGLAARRADHRCGRASRVSVVADAGYRAALLWTESGRAGSVPHVALRGNRARWRAPQALTRRGGQWPTWFAGAAGPSLRFGAVWGREWSRRGRSSDVVEATLSPPQPGRSTAGTLAYPRIDRLSVRPRPAPANGRMRLRFRSSRSGVGVVSLVAPSGSLAGAERRLRVRRGWNSVQIPVRPPRGRTLTTGSYRLRLRVRAGGVESCPRRLRLGVRG